MAKNRLEIILSGQVKEFNSALKEAQKQADDSFGAIEQGSKTAAAALSGLAISGALLTKSFIDKSVEMAQFRGTLIAVTKDVDQADAALKKMVEFAATTPFDLPGVVSAGVQLKSLKVDVDRFLPLAGDLAAVFNRDIKDSAQALAKALSGSQDGVTVLTDSFGISKREMKEAGAAMDSSGAIALKSSQDLEKLSGALEKIIKSKYGGAMEAQSNTAAGAFANLSDAIDQLKAALGNELADEFAALAKQLTVLVENFQGLPDTTKSMIAWSVVMVAGLGGIGLAASATVAALGPLVSAIGGMSAITAASTPITVAGTKALVSRGVAAVAAAGRQAVLTAAIATSVGPTAALTTATAGLAAATRAMLVAMGPIGVVVALGAAAAGLVHVYGKSVKASEELRVAQQKAADRFRESRKEIILAADALREYSGSLEDATKATTQKFIEAGKTDLDAQNAIVALQGQRLEAAKRGDEQRAQILLDRINVLRGVEKNLAGTQAAKDKAEKDKADAAKAAIEAQAKAQSDYEKRSQAGYYETKRAQLDALDSVLSGMKKEGEEFEKLSLSRVKLAREVAEEEKKAAETARKSKADAALYELEVLKSTADDNYQQRSAKLKDLLALDVFSTEERKKLELELLETAKTIEERKLEAHKKAEEAKTNATKEAAKRRAELAKSEVDLATDEVSATKEKLSRGEDVLAQLKEQIAARQALVETAILEAAAVDKVGKSKADQATIDKLAANHITKSRRESARESEAFDRQDAERKKKAQLETLKLQDQLAKAQLENDKKVTQGDLNRTAKERLGIAEEQLRLQAEINSASATPQEKARIQAQLELDIFNLRKQSTEELAAASEELEKAKKKAEELKGATLGGVQTLEEFVKSTNEQFAGAGREKPTTEGVTDSDRSKAAGALGVDVNARVPDSAKDGKSGKSSRFSLSSPETSSEDAQPSSTYPESDKSATDLGAKKVDGQEGGGGLEGLIKEGTFAVVAAIQAMHADLIAKKNETQVQIVAPQGQRNNDWSFKTTRTGQ